MDFVGTLLLLPKQGKNSGGGKVFLFDFLKINFLFSLVLVVVGLVGQKVVSVL